MEDSSHELIDQMIAEEQYCYGFDTVPHITSIGVLPVNQEQQQLQFPIDNSEVLSDTTSISVDKSSTLTENTPESTPTQPTTIFDAKEKREQSSSEYSSSQLPSHNQRWSEEEDSLLTAGVELFGYGHWKEVSEHVKTRNSLQCKNRARQKFPELQHKRPKPTKDNNVFAGSALNSVDKSIAETGTPPQSKQAEAINKTAELGESANPVSYDTPAVPQIDTAKQLSSATEDGSNVEEQASVSVQVEFEINLTEISEHERSENAEWFMGKPAKNPERYMRIRNHIINCWKKSSPNYLTKTAGRKNLADCGDVNAVGRIHAYLESIHAINVNCTSLVKRNYSRSSATRSEDSSPKKKKAKKTPGYFWADVDEDEEESENKSVIIKGDGKSRPKRAVKKPETFYNENGNEFGQGNDPFTLVPVGYYPNEKSAPFTVDITSDALLVMDFHSHLAYTEIIGLLGGRVVHGEDGSQQLKVEYVFPCRSTSTGIQCEMDPVSEMAAREVFEQKGLHVVGWYHSHPTFEPEPSIRDIENQTSYQDLFRDENSGVEPFIGVIITPYNSRNIVHDRSQFQFIHISKRWSSNNSYRLPFACLQKVTQCKTISHEVFEIFQNLIAEYKSYEHKINMELQYGQVSRLDKLMRSLKNHLFMEPEKNEKFLSDLRYMIQKNFNGEDEGQGSSNGGDSNIQHAMLSQESRQKQMDNIVSSLAI